MSLDTLTQAERISIASIHNKGGIPAHYNDSIGATAIMIRFDSRPSNLVIFNSHDSQSLYISFDGSNYFTILTHTSLPLENITSYDLYVKGSDAGTTYEILYW